MCHKCRKWIHGVPVRCFREGRFVWLCPKCWMPRRDRGKVYA